MCQPHSLHFASRQGHGGPIEGEIGQAQVPGLIRRFRISVQACWQAASGLAREAAFEPGRKAGGEGDRFRKSTPPRRTAERLR